MGKSVVYDFPICILIGKTLLQMNVKAELQLFRAIMLLA